MGRRLVKRLAGMTLLALRCSRQKVWLRSESHSASASTQPTGGLPVRLGHQTGQGGAVAPGRCARVLGKDDLRSTSTTVSHLGQCFEVRLRLAEVLTGRMK